jgi:ABC-type multidrug transport system ATPase subunit
MDYPATATVTKSGITRSYSPTADELTSTATSADVEMTMQLCGAVTFLQHDDTKLEAQTGYVSDFETGAIGNSQVAFSVRINESNADGESVGFQMSGPRVRPRPSLANIITYTSSGFLGVQSVVNDFLRCGAGSTDSSKCYGETGLKVKADAEYAVSPNDIALGSFGTPKWRMNLGLLLTGAFDFWGFIWMGVCIVLLPLMGRILIEKETKIREGMKMMGCRDSAFYLSTYLYHGFFSFGVSGFCVLVLFSIPDLITYSDPILVWFILWVVTWAAINQATAFTAFFNNSTMGKLAILGLMLMFSLIELALTDLTDPTAKAIWSLFLPFLAGKWAIAVNMIELEYMTQGATSETAAFPIIGYTLNDAIICGIFSGMLWLVIFMYLDQVVRQEFGVPRKKYFFLLPSFWKEEVFGISKTQGGLGGFQDLTDEESNNTDAQYFETVGIAQREMMKENKCVKVRNLRKVFHVDGKDFVAVNNVDFTMYRDEIFVLLGHNGAGKTTTFSMLTGLIPQSAGHVRFYGRTLENQLAYARDKVGICPQHSVLWPDLTALEHLLLFAKFKGVQGTNAEKQGRRLLREQYMEKDVHVLAGNMSGGMRRKLSLAIAFMGDPELVFLDEPTSGMDTAARREVWDLLRARKSNRVIILTTHYMDEADVLADRVSIMSHGKVKCSGTTTFLKNTYGCGYNLAFNLGAPAKTLVDKITAFLTPLFPGDALRLMSTAGSEVLFLVPFEASSCFQAAFDAIDKAKKTKDEELQILDWTLLVCNLEEVFLKVASEEESLIATKGLSIDGQIKEHVERKNSKEAAEEVAKAGDAALARAVSRDSDNRQVVVLEPHQGRQLAGLMRKRWTYAARNRGVTFCQLVCPLFWITLFLSLTLYSERERGRIKLSGTDQLNQENLDEDKRYNVPSSLGVFDGEASDAVPAFLVGTNFTAMGPAGTLMQELADQATASFVPVPGEAEKLVMLKGADHVKVSATQECPNSKCDQLDMDDLTSQTDEDGETIDPGFCPEEEVDALAADFSGLMDASVLAQVQMKNYGSGLHYMQFKNDFIKKYSYYLEETVKSTAADRSRYAAAAYGMGSYNLLLLNTTGVHVAPIFTQELYNAMNRRGLDSEDDAGGSLTAFVHPLPRTYSESIEQIQQAQFTIAVGILEAFAFVSCFGLVFIVVEKEMEIKTQQFVNGVSIFTYWISNEIFDVLMYVFPIVSCLALCAAFDLKILISERVIGAFIALLIGFSITMPLFSYVCAHFFKSADNALTAAVMVNVLFGVIMFIVGFMLELILIEDVTIHNEILKMISPLLRMWPVYTLGEGIRRIVLVGYVWEVERQPPENRGPCYFKECMQKEKEFLVQPHQCSQDVFDEYGAGPAVIQMYICAILYFCITLFIDFAQQSVWLRQKMPGQPKCPTWKDDPDNLRHLRDADVVAEENRVVELGSYGKTETAVYVKNLRKMFRVEDSDAAMKKGPDGNPAKKTCAQTYCSCCRNWCCCLCYPPPKRDIYAVRDVSLAINKGEVLGLLGANGAGKTTTFRMMCGIEVPSNATDTDIYIGGHSIYNERNECRKLIGYTAQDNPLWVNLTVKEHLEFYARVKGVLPNQIEEVVANIIVDMDLSLYVTKRAGQLSGGNKRKLVIAMSLIGTPPVLFLDEPSAGMDPEARRNMWSIIQNVATKKKQTTVILTTHSMDECEALCSKVVIMSLGVYRCFGEIPKIKAKYGAGYDFFVKLIVPSQEQKEHARKTFLGVQDHYDDMFLTWNDVYRRILEQVACGDIAELLGKSILQLISSKDSCFPTMARDAQKLGATGFITKEFASEQAIMERCKVSVLSEWLCRAQCNVELMTWTVATFANASLLERQMAIGTVTFRISDLDPDRLDEGVETQRSLGTLFGFVEGVREKFKISEYAITPTTLEQIFNTFTREDHFRLAKEAEGRTSTTVGAPLIAVEGSGTHGTAVGMVQTGDFGVGADAPSAEKALAVERGKIKPPKGATQ